MFDDLKFVKHVPNKLEKIIPPKPNENEMLVCTSANLKMLHDSLSEKSLNGMLCDIMKERNFIPEKPRNSLILRERNRNEDFGVILQLPTEILWKLDVDQLYPNENLASVNLTLPEAHELETKTMGQNQNELWFHERSKRITASQFKSIVCRKKPVDESFKDKIFHNSGTHKAVTRYMRDGIENESSAVKTYSDIKNCFVRQCGVCVNPGIPFLGASPDGAVNCNGDIGLLEIKTLSKAKELGLTVEEAVKKTKIQYLSMKSSAITVNKTHAYYYQMQGQMAVSGIKWCDLVVDSGHGMVFIERILFDETLWKKDMLPKLCHFYFKHKPK